MKKIALLNTGNKDFLGYKKILDQEKIPYETIKNIDNKSDLVIIPNSGKNIHTKDFKRDIIKLNNFGEQAVNSYLHYKDYKIPFSFLRILVNKYLSKPIKQISLREHRLFLKNKIKSMIDIEQIGYWPKNYKAAFCLRIDVDFPIKYFYKKKQILKALIDFKQDLDNLNIPASLFLNFEYPKEAFAVKKIFKNYDIQLHGCSKKVPHRRYGYDLNNIPYDDLYDMLKYGKEITNADIFAPPCEHVNKNVLDICEKLGFKAISAGHLGKDDIPSKCILDREYNLYNIPTTSLELLENIPLSYYLNEFKKTVNSNSLFCIYFHPILLLNKKNKIISLLKKVKQTKNLWITIQSELVDWWDKRNNIDIISDSTLINKNNTSVDINIVKFAGSKQKSKKIRLKLKQKKKYSI